MTMENLISLQSSGSRSIGEPMAPRPAGVHLGSVLIILDVNKGVNPAALYWALANVVRKDDTVKILGIVTHIPNASKPLLSLPYFSVFSRGVHQMQYVVMHINERSSLVD